MSDGIIDLSEYISRRGLGSDPDRGTFALWGAEGERSRFALPLWRIAYLASGDRAGIVWHDADDPDPEKLESYLVLDLREDPPRIEFTTDRVRDLREETAPAVADRPDGSLTVALGEHSDGRTWYLVVEGPPGRASVVPRVREDILFLAGECAGLLFLREFADELEEDD